MHDTMSAGPHSPTCPFREVYEHTGHDSPGCPFCSGFFSKGLLKALRQLTELPDIISRQPASAATRK